MRSKFSIYDKVLWGALCLIFIGIMLLLFMKSNQSASTLVVTRDGNEIGRYSLDEDQVIPIIKDEETTNIVCIQNGFAYMQEANCPDHLCMKQRKISKDKETIVCLPNRLVLCVYAEESAEFDSISK